MCINVFIVKGERGGEREREQEVAGPYPGFTKRGSTLSLILIFCCRVDQKGRPIYLYCNFAGEGGYGKTRTKAH